MNYNHSVTPRMKSNYHNQQLTHPSNITHLDHLNIILDISSESILEEYMHTQINGHDQIKPPDFRKLVTMASIVLQTETGKKY